VFFTKKKKRTVENESWFYHIFRKNSDLVHAKTSTSYDTVENALSVERVEFHARAEPLREQHQ
jgi:hypothetical protein